MKSLSTALSAALGAPVQRPGLLVEMHFTVVQRWSSHGTVTWGGHTWAARGLRAQNLLVQPLRVSGDLVLDNADDEIGTLALSQGVQDRRVVIYGYDAGAAVAGALADVADAVWLATAVGSACSVSARQVQIALRHRAEFVQSPRTYVGAAAGITQLLPADTVLRINGIDMRLERRG